MIARDTGHLRDLAGGKPRAVYENRSRELPAGGGGHDEVRICAGRIGFPGSCWCSRRALDPHNLTVKSELNTVCQRVFCERDTPGEGIKDRGLGREHPADAAAARDEGLQLIFTDQPQTFAAVRLTLRDDAL